MKNDLTLIELVKNQFIANEHLLIGFFFLLGGIMFALLFLAELSRRKNPHSTDFRFFEIWFSFIGAVCSLLFGVSELLENFKL